MTIPHGPEQSPGSNPERKGYDLDSSLGLSQFMPLSDDERLRNLIEGVEDPELRAQIQLDYLRSRLPHGMRLHSLGQALDVELTPKQERRTFFGKNNSDRQDLSEEPWHGNFVRPAFEEPQAPDTIESYVAGGPFDPNTFEQQVHDWALVAEDWIDPMAKKLREITYDPDLISLPFMKSLSEIINPVVNESNFPDFRYEDEQTQITHKRLSHSTWEPSDKPFVNEFVEIEKDRFDKYSLYPKPFTEELPKHRQVGYDVDYEQQLRGLGMPKDEASRIAQHIPNLLPPNQEGPLEIELLPFATKEEKKLTGLIGLRPMLRIVGERLAREAQLKAQSSPETTESTTDKDTGPRS